MLYAFDGWEGSCVSVQQSRRINIRPGVSVLGVFKDMNYKTWYAIGEFVDNSLQSYVENREELRRLDGAGYRLRIEIETEEADGGAIVIRDNAAGISSQRYEQAFITAEPPPNRTGLSRYGIGMKSAACWFANKWSVRTKAINEDIERTLRFDIPNIMRSKIETLEPEEKRVVRDKHFTEIRLWDLHEDRRDIFAGRTIGKVCLHLTSMYRMFLGRDELTLVFNGEELAYQPPEILSRKPVWEQKGQEVEWAKPISFEFGVDKRAYGSAALMAKGRRASAGFALFQNDRLIEGSVDDAYRPREIFGGMESFRNLRLFGQMNVVGVGVAHTKDKFTWSEQVEDEFLSKLKTELERPPLQLLRQADNMRVRTSEQVSEGGLERAIEGTASALEALASAVEAEVHEPPVSLPPVPRGVEGEGSITRQLDLNVNGEDWRITLELTKDASVTDWLFVGATEAGPAGVRTGGAKSIRRILIRVQIDHPFMNQWVTSWQTVEAIVRVAAGIGIAEVTARESGATMPSTVRAHLNRYLREALSQPKVVLTQDDIGE